MVKWITKLLDHLQGAKTYLVAIAAIITAIVGYLNGVLDLKSLIEAVFAAIATMTLRHGISTVGVEPDKK